MKSLLFVVVLLAVGIVALGFYQGWFHVSSDSADHNANMTISVDQDKFKEDKDKAKETVKDLGHKAKEKTGVGAEKVKETEKVKEPRP